MEADDLDDVLLLLLDPEAAQSETAKTGRITKRIASMVGSSRFWPEREGPNGLGSAVLLLEELACSGVCLGLGVVRVSLYLHFKK